MVEGSLQSDSAQGQPGWKGTELSGSLEKGSSVQTPVILLAQLVVAVMVITACLHPANMQSWDNPGRAGERVSLSRCMWLMCLFAVPILGEY